MKVAIVAIFKNESMGLREWLEHYKWQGVDRILLLDNNSTDNWKEKSKGFESFIEVVPVQKDHAQTEHYNQVGMPWLKANAIDVVGVVDLDEYVFGTDGKPLKAHLERLFSDDTLGKVQLTWRAFGSSGMDRQPSSIRKGFTWRKKDDPALNIKCFSRVRNLIAIQVHDHEVKGKAVRDPPGLQLNHYAIQSREFYEKVKMKRGDVQHANATNLRNWAYFKKHDFDDLEDTLLKDQVEAFEKLQRGGRRKRGSTRRRKGTYKRLRYRF